jgi:hypothetical protein
MEGIAMVRVRKQKAKKIKVDLSKVTDGEYLAMMMIAGMEGVMRTKQWHIKTHTTRHFVSTVWLDILDTYETMTFDKRKEKIDWTGTDTNRTTSKRIAIANHFKAVRKALGSHAKNA